MIKPEIPINEDQRLAALRSYKLLDTLPEDEFDDLVSIASSICNTPISIISFIDRERLWFKSIQGMLATEMPRETSFCGHVINQDEVLYVQDATKDERFKDNPLVIGDPNIRFYAGTSIVDADGFALGSLCVADSKPRDLTEVQLKALKSLARSVENLLKLRQTAKQLKNSKYRYEELLKNVGDLIFELDENGFYTYVNATLEKATGYRSSELKEMRFTELIYQPDLEELLQAALKRIKGKKKESYNEFRIVTKTGEVRWVGQTTNFSYDGDRMVKIWAVARDIDEKKKIQESLSEQEVKYRLLSDNISDLICLHEPNGKYTFVSPSVKNLLGYDPQDLIGKDAYKYFHPEDVRHISENSHKHVLEGKDVPSIIFRLRKKNGEYIWAETYTTPIKDSRGEVVALQTATRDISRLIEQQEALKEAKVRAESAVIEKSNFLSTMSHEIRTPLNAIIGIGNILSEENPSPTQLEYLKLLKFSGENLMNLVNNILDFSKIDESKIKLTSEPFNLTEMVSSTIDSLKLQAVESNVQLKLEISPLLPTTVVGDRMRMIQVLNNLVANAIKFANQTSVIVRVKSETIQNGNVKILFEVEDHGVGIPADKLERIFDRFVQASDNTTRQFGGSGLGLTISNKLIQLMGSKIEVVSEKDRGSKFFFKLSLPVSSTEARTYKKRNELTNLTSHDINLLLVEDNEINRLIAMRFLKKWGVNANYAENGLLAVEAAKRSQYDIILMDLQMPVMDGYESSRLIREMDGYQSVPILALTASTEAHLNKQLMESSPIQGVISKPFSPDNLHKKITSALKISFGS
ncbi:MAG: PAS domain S-box protein [Cyclobacteriaceae bacterium]